MLQGNVIPCWIDVTGRFLELDAGVSVLDAPAALRSGLMFLSLKQTPLNPFSLTLSPALAQVMGRR